MSKTIFVYAGWQSFSEPKLIGTLNADLLRGKEIFSFEYDLAWLETQRISFFDPDLQLFKGRQWTAQDKTLFGIFTDSCPDRWGRLLMTRREAVAAREENRNPKKLTESDFLLGIQDASRTGALRFKTDLNGAFLAEDSKNAIPIWTLLRELEQTSLFLEKEDKTFEEEKRWLKILLQPGSSLGGARPKATVQDTNGGLWIAKFPSKHDEFDSGAWEMVVHELALLCGLNVPEAKCEAFSKNGSTFLVKRFDRAQQKRIHFVSAMTVLGKTDGNNSQDGTSYLDIAGAIMQNGSHPGEDLRELWKRIVFSIAVTNTDDHLRNHGFLFDGKGLRLSPVYDVNPNPDGTGLSLNIDETDNALDFDVAVSAAKYFGIKKDDAQKTVKEIQSHVSRWKSIAEKYGVPRSEIIRMETCFNGANATSVF